MRRLMPIMALALLPWMEPAAAQDFPSRVIRIVVAFPAGGPTDLVARLLADKVKAPLGQNVIVENKPGANGAIGADYVANGEPDGHLLFLTTVGAVAITPHLSKPNYDSLRDFAPVTLVVRPTTILVVKPDMPVGSAKELAALAKDKPGAIPFASTGSGSMPHLALELFQAAAGVKFLHVPYRGAAPALTDLLGGQVQALFADTPVLLPHIQGGKLKPIAAASASRNPLLPDVSTLAEQGFADTVADNWYGLLAPAKTPPAVVAKLHGRGGSGARGAGHPRQARAVGRRSGADVERGFRHAAARRARALGPRGAGKEHQGGMNAMRQDARTLNRPCSRSATSRRRRRAVAETLKVAVAQRGFWNSTFIEVGAQAGLLQGGRPRHRDPLHRGRRLDAHAGDRRQHRHRHDQRHPRRGRRLRQGHAGEDHQRGSDRRGRSVLVCAAGKRHQEPRRYQRQDRRVLLARLLDQSHSSATRQPGQGRRPSWSRPAARRARSRR